VDEDDLIKTDGSMIYSLAYRHDSGTYVQKASLQAHQRAADGIANKTASIDLDKDVTTSGMHLAASAKRIALLGSRWDASRYTSAPTVVDTKSSASSSLFSYPQYSQFGAYKVTLTLLDTSAPTSLPVTKNIAIDGNLVGSRLIGNMLYLTTTWSPRITADAMPLTATTEERDAVLALLKTSDILPTIQIDGAKATPLVADTDCYVQVKNASLNLQITTITAIDLNSPSLQRSSRCFVGGNEGIYVSPNNVYIATTRYTYNADAANPGLWYYPYDISTDLHKFSIDGLTVRYKASGEVKGHLGWDPSTKPYRFSEYNDDLRVITFTGSTGWWNTPAGTASPATLTILREQTDAASATKLNAIATLPNSKRPETLGVPGEQLYAVRFAADRGYLVTFRRTDPLYVLDLSDPLDPKTVGELKAPGYSDYLYPIGRSLLLGVGRDATDAGRVQGVKVGLIDVSDVKTPREIATRVIGQSWSTSALDFSSHGINLFTDGDITRVALPVTVYDQLINFYSYPNYNGLHRFEVNAQAKTLVDKPYVLGTMFPTNGYDWIFYQNTNVAFERSVQIGPQVYYLTGGEIKSSNW
jgi:hypothetical protein